MLKRINNLYLIYKNKFLCAYKKRNKIFFCIYSFSFSSFFCLSDIDRKLDIVAVVEAFDTEYKVLKTLLLEVFSLFGVEDDGNSRNCLSILTVGK